MIPVDRGPPPAGWQAASGAYLKAAWEAYRDDDAPSTALTARLSGYRDVGRALYDRQHKKCAYCERAPGWEAEPVEHFRPKGGADRHLPWEPKQPRDTARYWWLTWTWENLLFCCHHCNSGRKKNTFPLEAGATALPTPSRTQWPIDDASFDLASEAAVLIDPADPTDHPLRHLQWAVVDRAAPRAAWRWMLEGITTRGEVTGRLLGLDALADLVGHHDRTTVVKRFDGEVDAVAGRGDLAGAEAAFAALGADLLARRGFFVGATWWMLDTLREDLEARSGAALTPLPLP